MYSLLLTRGPLVTVELAVTPYERMVGLQGRKYLPENYGMLFIFPFEGNNAFHMKNTPMPLDLLFFDDKGRLVGFIDSAPALSLRQLSVSEPSRFVLEIHAGWRARHGLQVGDRITHTNVP